jgi:hypothetical protein
MSTDFPHQFVDLLEARFATLATIGKDGGPQLTETAISTCGGRP